ncbi:MAG TPA: TlpA family protein disulfide reductase [Firmicutes bacterium]|jgi:cytochrome c biogenesis protein CcmG, thiol:disulfide interchange protein DsbE|nr:TlpA family protein disulfide reductase [Bacillota bacterium]
MIIRFLFISGGNGSMGKRIAFGGIAVLVVLALICGLNWLSNKKNEEVSSQVRPAIGYLAPDFTLRSLDGKAVRLAAVARNSRLTLVNFWGIWCPYCVKEIPDLVRFDHQYAGDRKVVLLGVDVGDDPKAVPGFVLKNKMNYPILQDKDNKVSSLYQVQGFPTTVIIDHRGVIRDLIIGETNFAGLEEKVKKLLSEK